MKRFLTVMICAIFTVYMVSAQQTSKKTNVVKTKFFIESMDCDNCIKKIEKNISFVKGVTDLKCNLETQTVEVTYRSDKTTEAKLLNAFKKIDKPATVMKDEANK